jgi:hypothetical protein
MDAARVAQAASANVELVRAVVDAARPKLAPSYEFPVVPDFTAIEVAPLASQRFEREPRAEAA